MPFGAAFSGPDLILRPLAAALRRGVDAIPPGAGIPRIAIIDVPRPGRLRMAEILGVTLDFYQTLVRHRGGQGRGASLMEYLAYQGLSSNPWERQVLYDVFEFYGSAYNPGFSADESKIFWTGFTRRLFGRLGVCGAENPSPADHAEAVRDLLGPASLALYEDVIPTLKWLKQRGLPAGIVSNWQRGLGYFCRELGLLDYVDFVVVSAEVGCQKPDRRIFEIAANRIALPPPNVLHVGDHPVEDIAGAVETGLQAALLARDGGPSVPNAPSISSLAELRKFPGLHD